MNKKQCKKAMFLTIERPLDPPPPRDAIPRWYLVDTLGFFDVDGKKVWEQKIPEAQLLWKPLYHHDNDKWEYWRDEFAAYFFCQAFKDSTFGWQLRLKISHHYAEIWHSEIMAYIRKYHENHFKKEKQN